IKDFTFNPKPKNYFAWLGRIHYGKGMWEAVHASKETKSNLIAAGNITCESDEKYFKTVEPMIDGKKRKYIGEVGPKEKNKLLRGAKALLFPIRWEEPFGLVMAEAMACGTPVIAFRRGSVPEIVKHGVTGFVVEDEKGLIEAIKNISKINRAECRKHVEKHFTIERMVDAYEEVYVKIINAKK
ncbi:MAG: glycosyltransferase, partial [Minisyncoccia bacterium]